MWKIEDALTYYKDQGAARDQGMLISLLQEVQQACGGAIPAGVLPTIAQGLAVKESYLLALIKKMPRLRLSDAHTLELCAGANCSKRSALAAFVEKTYGSKPQKFTVKYVSCMRLCGKGPNIRWDGKLYHQADEALIRSLVENV